MHKIQVQSYQPHQLRYLAPLLGIIFIDSLAFFLVIPVLLRVFLDPSSHVFPSSMSMGTRNILYSITVASAMLAFLISSPIVGMLSDRHGRKKTLSFCLSLTIIGYILPIIGILSQHWSLLLIGRLLTGASSSSQPIAQAAIADITAGRRKAYCLSLIAFAMTLALMLGPLLGSYLSDTSISPWFTVETPYWIGATLAIINFLVLIFLFNDASQIIEKLESRNKWNVLWSVLKQNQLLELMLVFALLELAWSQYYQASFLFLKEQFAFTTNHIGLFATYAGLWMSLGLTVVYRLAIRVMSIEKFSRLSYVGALIGFFGCLIPNSPLWQWIFVIPMAIFVGTAYASLLAILSNRTAAEHQGWILGTASMLLGLAWLITSSISGILINWHLFAPNINAALMILVGTGLLLKTVKR